VQESELRVPHGLRFWGSLFSGFPSIVRRLANLETRVLAEAIADVAIEQPVYIAGFARSGSTMLLEAFASHPSFTSHRYSDYPLLWTPYWWNALREQLPLPENPPKERAHRDGIAVTQKSPEAFEEVFWMHFFPKRHDPETDQLLDETTSNRKFEAFYRAHVRKLLAVRRARRYVAKGNYNVARLGYLQAIFPDARFIVPWREPLAHVASLLKQDRLFCEAAKLRPEVANHLARTGHFEFGPQARVERIGPNSQAAMISANRSAGKSAVAYAMQWADVYGSLLDRFDASPMLRTASHLVSYEALCTYPQRTLSACFQHANANDAAGQQIVDTFAGRLRAPDYYQPHFDPETREEIEERTSAVYARLKEASAN
jgi:hypothetical protein